MSPFGDVVVLSCWSVESMPVGSPPLTDRWFCRKGKVARRTPFCSAKYRVTHRCLAAQRDLGLRLLGLKYGSSLDISVVEVVTMKRE